MNHTALSYSTKGTKITNQNILDFCVYLFNYLLTELKKMRLKYQFAFILFCLFFFGCKVIDKTRGYYDIERSEYDVAKARQQLKDLKEGILIVSVPSERHKLRLFKNTDTEKYEKALAIANRIFFSFNFLNTG